MWYWQHCFHPFIGPSLFLSPRSWQYVVLTELLSSIYRSISLSLSPQGPQGMWYWHHCFHPFIDPFLSLPTNLVVCCIDSIAFCFASGSLCVGLHQNEDSWPLLDWPSCWWVGPASSHSLQWQACVCQPRLSQKTWSSGKLPTAHAGWVGYFTFSVLAFITQIYSDTASSRNSARVIHNIDECRPGNGYRMV